MLRLPIVRRMPDIVAPHVRSRMMSGIRGKDTKPELLIRKALHSMGFRFRLHSCNVPGKPDLIFPRYRAAIFVNGCFWHGHDCALFKMPDTRRPFWEAKIESNRARDAKVADLLSQQGWRQLTIWECAFRGVRKIGIDSTIERTADWLRSDIAKGEVRSLRNEEP